jgi:DoxX-like family
MRDLVGTGRAARAGVLGVRSGLRSGAGGNDAACVVSGSAAGACLGDMYVFYLAITILAVLANGYAAALDFVGAESVKLVADRVQVSRRWMVPLGMLLASGAAGLVAGLAVPALGTAAAIGLILYFICAVSAHLRVGDRGIAPAAFFLLLAASALAANLAYHEHW